MENRNTQPVSPAAPDKTWRRLISFVSRLAEISGRSLTAAHERQCRMVMEIDQDGVFLIDRTGLIEYANPRAARQFFGDDRPAAGKAKTIQDLIPAIEYEALKRSVARVMESGKSLYFDSQVSAGGALRWLETRLFPLHDNSLGVMAVLGIFRDVTERKRSEERIEENRYYMSAFLNNMPGMAYRCANDQDWTMSYVSNGSIELTGYFPEDLKNNRIISYSRLIAEPDRERVWHEIQAALSEFRPFAIEYRLITATGVEKWVLEQGQGVIADDGKVVAIEGFIFDITGFKKVEEALRESEEMYRTLVQTSPDAVVVVDLDGTVINVSSKALELYGCSAAEELVGENVFKMIAPEDQNRIRLNTEKIMLGVSVGACEYLFIRKNGTTICGEVTSSLLKDAHGKSRAVIAVVRDITDRKKTERALSQSEKRFRELWENAPVAYHMLDARGVVTGVNRTEAQMMGYTVEEMLGRPVFDFILPEQREEARQHFLQKLSGSAASRSENRVYVKKDGTPIYVSIDDVLETDANNNVIGVRTTMVDVTHRKWAEQELQQSVAQLEKAMESIIQAMTKIVEMKDPYTAGHQKRVAQLACAIAREMRMPEDQVSGLYMASVIHDIGKIYVPAEILSKPGKLSEIEFSMIKTHPKVSYDILKMVEFPWPIATIVVQHHERLDGSGYPEGLSGAAIIPEARILCVADVVEAIAFNRPYRSGVGIESALKELALNRGTRYDADVVDSCLKLFKSNSFQFNS